MRHLIFEPSDAYPIALLCKTSSFMKPALESNYVAPLMTAGVARGDIVAFTVEYNDVGKAPAKFIKGYLDTLAPVLQDLGTKYLYVADSAYFKVLAKVTKAEPHWGYVLPCQYPGFEGMQVVLGLNYQALVYNPDLQAKLDNSLQALVTHYQGQYVAPGTGIIHSAQYPQSYQDIASALQSLHEYPNLTCDLETFSLRFNEAGIATIAFAWDEHNGIAFACDYQCLTEPPDNAPYGANAPHYGIRALIREFFESYQGNITWHNCTFDTKCSIYALWMNDLLDTVGLAKGRDIMFRDIDDTKVIAYLATNSTAGNHLGLKTLAHEFAGNWAKEEINDVCQIPLPELLQYNLVDALSTWYVKKKYYPIMVQDGQEPIYKELMLPSAKLITQMELTGMPMDGATIQAVKAQMEAEQARPLSLLENHPAIRVLNLVLQNKAMEAANAKLKVKQHPLEHFKDVAFNPNSGPQIQCLLYEQMGLPVLDLTDTKLPATGAKTIKKLLEHPASEPYRDILQALIDYSEVSKILSTFIPAFETGIDKADGMKYLHGCFNLGGAVSGRLSSSDPNLQNLPAAKTYGKLVKSLFQPPPGWIFGGADFSSLEDRINALLTKDPNKIKVYTDGFDGHCLRAKAYFGDQMPDVGSSVEEINSIEARYPKLRQQSKSPTFALTYQGTWITLTNNLGFPEEQAKQIEHRYHELYKVSDEWVQDRITEAAKQGYSELAFGLRLRTPLLSQVMWGSSRVPYEAQAEARTLGNAVSGQSYGLLNNRAAVAFFQKVWASEYRYDILPVSLIHDAIYILMRDDVRVVAWANKHLIEEMSWQGLPEIKHPDVHLGAELDLFYPSWAEHITLPNNADEATIRRLCDGALAKQKAA
jgi:DNA polymerase-1